MKNLSQVREDINRIDNVLHAQMDARMQCSDAVARAKLQTKDPVYKPKREQEILTRFEDDCYYQRFMRKVMQLSRHDQYGMFLKESETEPEFLSQTQFLTGDGHACDICVKLQADATCENAMNQTQMLSVISDWFADIRSLKVEGDEIVFVAHVTQADREKTLVCLYMLYKESLKCTIEKQEEIDGNH